MFDIKNSAFPRNLSPWARSRAEKSHQTFLSLRLGEVPFKISFLENAWCHRNRLFINQRYGAWLQSKYVGIRPSDWDYSYLEFLRRAVQHETDPRRKSNYLHSLRFDEAYQDLWIGSVKEISPLVQFDPEPNQELKEVKVELYKISISFTCSGGKLNSK